MQSSTVKHYVLREPCLSRMAQKTFQQPQVVELTDGYVDRKADHNCLITTYICILLIAIFAN